MLSPFHRAATTAILVSLCITAQPVNAKGSDDPLPPAVCKPYSWKPGNIMYVEGKMNIDTHITLPEDGLDVLWGNKDLWSVEWVQNHIFVKPLSKQPEGAETNLTAIGHSGNAYEFMIRRSDRSIVPCITINTNGALITKANWRKADDNKDALVATLTQQLASQRAQAEAARASALQDAEKQGREALKQYRKEVYTGYQWNDAKGFFAEGKIDGKGVIDSVYDDGRFTYVRLSRANRGLMSILAELEGKTELLEYSYEAPTKVYQISGIFPKFAMKTGESSITITRKAEGGE